MISRLLPICLATALAGCGALGDGGVAVQSVLGSFEAAARAPEGACVWEGRLIVPAGVGADISLCAPDAAPAPDGVSVSIGEDSLDTGGPEHFATPSVDRVAAQLLEDEGYERLPYLLDGTCHIAVGQVVDDSLCEGIEAAETEARRLADLHGIDWEALGGARRDALVIFCYWAACAGYGEAWSALRRGEYSAAADEILDLDGRATLPRIDFTRAADLAETVRMGEWSFADTRIPGRD